MLGATASFHHSPLPQEVSLDNWHPQMGDRVVIDTKENEGYLIHPNGRFTKFPVITGQRRWVNYIGRSYNAKTPAWDWVAKSKHIQGDRYTYGPTGKFIRLYRDGKERTAYGIHRHADEDIMFERKNRFQSMGCIIVRSHVLDVIERTFDVNEGNMTVITRYGIEDPMTVAYVG